MHLKLLLSENNILIESKSIKFRPFCDISLLEQFLVDECAQQI
jgi:hypothetical protein